VLGHSSRSITLDVYADLFDRAQHEDRATGCHLVERGQTAAHLGREDASAVWMLGGGQAVSTSGEGSRLARWQAVQAG
jgi:hypothetical protein